MAQPSTVTVTGFGMCNVPADGRETQEQPDTGRPRLERWPGRFDGAAVDTNSEVCNLNLPWYLPPSAGFNLMSSSHCASFQNAGNSESGSTSASASGRGPLAAVTMFT